MRRVVLPVCLAALLAVPVARAADLKAILQPVVSDLLQMQADQADSAKLGPDAAGVLADVAVARPAVAASKASHADKQTAKVLLENAACAASAVAKAATKGKLTNPAPAQMTALTKAFTCITRAIAAGHKLGLHN